MLNNLPKDVILIINSYLDYESKIWFNKVLEDKIECQRLSKTTLVNHKYRIDVQKLYSIYAKDYLDRIKIILIFEYLLNNDLAYRCLIKFKNEIIIKINHVLEYEDEEEDLTYLKQIANKLLTKVQSCENVKIVIHYNDYNIIYD